MAEILRFVQNDRRRVQNDKHGICLIATHSPRGEGEGGGEVILLIAFAVVITLLNPIFNDNENL